MRSVRFDSELDDRVQRAAAREGTSVSEFIRAAAAERADTVLGGESLLDALGDYVGSFTSGGDASRHSEEFGEALEKDHARTRHGRLAG